MYNGFVKIKVWFPDQKTLLLPVIIVAKRAPPLGTQCTFALGIFLVLGQGQVALQDLLQNAGCFVTVTVVAFSLMIGIVCFVRFVRRRIVVQD